METTLPLHNKNQDRLLHNKSRQRRWSVWLCNKKYRREKVRGWKI